MTGPYSLILIYLARLTSDQLQIKTLKNKISPVGRDDRLLMGHDTRINLN